MYKKKKKTTIKATVLQLNIKATLRVVQHQTTNNLLNVIILQCFILKHNTFCKTDTTKMKQIIVNSH
jgi:hypothetical protein